MLLILSIVTSFFLTINSSNHAISEAVGQTRSMRMAEGIPSVSDHTQNGLVTDASDSQLTRAKALNEQALTLLNQGQFKKALPLARNALSLREEVLGDEHVEVAESLNTLGLILHQLTELSEAQSVIERSLRIRERKLGPLHRRVSESLTNLGRVLYAKGQFSKARPLLQRGLNIREDASGMSAPEVGMSLIHLAIVDMQLGDLAKGENEIERAIEILELLQESHPVELAMALNVYGNVLKRQGKYAAARSSLEQSLVLREQHLGASHPHVARTLNRLGTLAAQLGDLPLSLSLLQRALQIMENSLGAQNAEVAGMLNEVGRIYRIIGNLDNAQSHFERALQIQERTVGADHPFVAVTLNELGRVLRMRRQWESAAQLFTRALAIQEASVGMDHPFLAETLTNLGYVEGRVGQLNKASKSFAQALRLRQRFLGDSHPDVASSYVDMAKIYHAQGNFSEARQHYDLARRAYLQLTKVRGQLDDRTLSRIWARQLAGLQHFLLLLGSEISKRSKETDYAEAIEESFTVAEQARGWVVQAAVAKALAGQQFQDAEKANQVRRVDELRQRRQQLWTQLNQELVRQKDDRDEALIRRLTTETARAEAALQSQVEKLEEVLPRFAELTLPQPLTIQQAKSLLQGEEALISFYALADRLQIWIVRPGSKVQYHSVSVKRSRLAILINRFRQSLLPTFSFVTNQLALLPVDISVAHELYQLLFEPIMSHLKGVSNLILVPDAVLLPLPFSVLLTASDRDAVQQLAKVHREGRALSKKHVRQYATLPWLVKRFPLTVLPSASALRLIRGDDLNTEKRKPSVAFMGFGDPLLKGTGQDRGGTMLAKRGFDVNRDDLLALNRLPGTRRELLAMASAMGVAQDDHVFLAEAATEPSVRKLQESGRLGQARVLAFATHGLLAGELRGLSQPALVLTPPSTLSEQDDGLLSMEEILQWHLPATEWVVLSACNTGASDGSGEGLSGLARAFFYAGAKTLLVSQWSVDDRATQYLMGEVFQRYGGDQTLAPAVALQQGMLALMQHTGDADTAYFAHPYAWAPFFLVGAGQ